LDPVAGATALPLLDDVAGLSQIVDDAPDAPFRDSDGRPDLTQAHLGIASDADEYSGVVGQENPIRTWGGAPDRYIRDGCCRTRTIVGSNQDNRKLAEVVDARTAVVVAE